MSFATTLRDELAATAIKPLCCRQAYLYGLLYTAEVERDTVTTVLSVPSDAACDVAEHTAGLIHTLYHREPLPERFSRGAHRYARLTFSNKNLAHRLHDVFTLPEDEAALDVVEELLGFKCPHCAAHFLRGVFMASGTVSDPAKSFHLEFKLPDDGRVEPLYILLCESGYIPGRTSRKGACGLFYKSGDDIQEVVAYLGASASVFAFYNAQIERDIRNNENRATNCVTENINRATRTGTRHLVALTYLEEHDLISALPEDLQFTARLRLNNPDVTLSELAELHFPPITKSGLYHRLEKILNFYEKAKSKET